ncbi:MAG: AMP-binding protein [Bacteroidales bacterium]|nr:AMP-binding protein [Bacteroidales bacterium]
MYSLSDKPFVFKSVNEMMETSFRNNWDRPALSNYKGVTLSYHDVARRIAKLHIAFEQCGLKQGDKVAICSRNQANWGVSFLAALTYGAIPVPLLHEFKPDNIHFLVNHSEAKVLFVEDSIWENLSIEEMPDLLVVVQINTFSFLYARTEDMRQVREHLNESFGKKYPNNFFPEDIHYYRDSPDEMAMINYTSGTSGFSKGVMIPYRALSSNIQFAKLAEAHINNESDVVSMLPTAHMYGFMFEFLFEMTVGAHVHFLNRIPSPKIIMQALGEIKPHIIVAVPLIIEKIYKTKVKPILEKNKIFFKLPILDKLAGKKICDEFTSSFGGRFEEVILGGAAFNPEVEAFFHKIGFRYSVGYGMTEGAPIFSYAHWDHTRLGSCGVVAPWHQMKIESPDPQNIPGEVMFKGPNVFLGYYKNPEATAATITDDGWIHTGDVGVVDKDGFLYLRGRSKCMILGPSGQNIYPEELEAVINNVKYVIDSLVVEDHVGLVALVYADENIAAADGIEAKNLGEYLNRNVLPEVNKVLPNYAQIKKMELIPEDFERTPKKSIKRYLYQRK